MSAFQISMMKQSFILILGDLIGCTYTGLESSKPTEPSLIIFIHALKNGLFRIRMEGESLRYDYYHLTQIIVKNLGRTAQLK